jgi:hypothetical protein
MQENKPKEADTSGPDNNVEFVPGTRFNGLNRKELREVGHRGGGQKPQARVAGKKKKKHWVVEEREARLKAAAEALDKAKTD